MWIVSKPRSTPSEKKNLNIIWSNLFLVASAFYSGEEGELAVASNLENMI